MLVVELQKKDISSYKVTIEILLKKHLLTWVFLKKKSNYIRIIVSNLQNIIHGVGIPFSALTSVIFGLMIVSFPLGAYAIFNSEIGDDIDYNFPLEKFDMFLAGINLQFPLEYEIGDIFITVWSIFIILFVISFLGPKKNFMKTISDILSNGKNTFSDNYMINQSFSN